MAQRRSKNAAAELALPSDERIRAAAALAERARRPAVVGNILFGTAGWTDRSLIQSRQFYPAGISSARARLGHYAKNFNLVEVDATYYTLLERRIAERWVAWTPDVFRFDVKAFPVFTGHPIDTERLPADLREALRQLGQGPRIYPDKLPSELASEIERRFFDFVEPLVTCGRLGCVMLQFPPWFVANRGNVRKLEALRTRWPDISFSVEFRNRSWLEPGRAPRVMGLLRALGMAYVVVDEPDVEQGGVPPVVSVTSPELALVRFHGHNVSGWRKGASVAERFNYLYSPEEMAAWSEPVRRLATEARAVHAVFNNCVRNYAVVNAQGLSVLVAGR